VTASEEHVPERRQDQRRQVAQPAYYGENRTAVRRTDDGAPVDGAPVDGSPATEPSLAEAIPTQDYEFLTGLIAMEHSG
jgi:hypothetical protein